MIVDDAPATAGTQADVRPAAPHRVLTRPRRLPGGRAVVGGLLVAVAALGAIVLATSGSGPRNVEVVVASRPIAPGDALGPDVLRVESMPVADGLVRHTYANPTQLEGTVSRSSLEPGELLQPGDVVESTAAQRAAAPAREITVQLEADRVGGGALEAGDRVDLIATYGSGADAFSTVVLVDAAVLDARTTADAIGSSRRVVVTLALRSRAETVAVAHAADVAQMRLVRTTTAVPDDDPVATFHAVDPGTDDAGGSDR